MVGLDLNSMIDHVVDRYNYYIIFLVMFIGFFNAVYRTAHFHRLIALSIFQSSVIFLFLTIGFNYQTSPPVIDFNDKTQSIIYNNPLPHALMLTAIVVGVATFAVGLAMIIKISNMKNNIKDLELLNQSINHHSKS